MAKKAFMTVTIYRGDSKKETRINADKIDTIEHSIFGSKICLLPMIRLFGLELRKTYFSPQTPYVLRSEQMHAKKNAVLNTTF